MTSYQQWVKIATTMHNFYPQFEFLSLAGLLYLDFRLMFPKSSFEDYSYFFFSDIPSDYDFELVESLLCEPVDKLSMQTLFCIRRLTILNKFP